MREDKHSLTDTRAAHDFAVLSWFSEGETMGHIVVELRS